MLNTYARFVTDHARLVLTLSLVLTAIAVTRIVDVRTGEPRLFLDASVNSLLPEEDEDRLYYDRIRRIFGSDETLVLAVHQPEGIFQTASLSAIQAITERLEGVEGVHHVVSLSNAPHMRSIDGDLDIGRLFESVPTDPAALELLRAEAFDDPLLRKGLLSEDGTTAGFLIYLLEIPENEFTAKRLDLRMKEIADQEIGDDATAWLTGGAHVKAETVRFLLRDLSVLIPLAFLAMSIIAAVSFRSARGVVIPMSTIGLGLAWTMGGIAELGESLNLVTIAVPVLVLVIGFAYAVHVTSTYYEAVQEPDGATASGSAACRGLAHVVLPTLLTGATTAAGFLALTTSPLPAIQSFGIFCTVGVVSTMVASLTWAPALLQLLSEPEPRTEPTTAGMLDGLLERLGVIVVRQRRWILLGGAVIAGLALVGITRIDITTDLVSNFAPDADVRVSYESVNDKLDGAGQVYLVLETDYKGAWKEPANLALIEELQAWFDTQDDVGGTNSLVDYVKLIHRGFNGSDPAYYRIPETKTLTSQLLMFGGSDEIERFVDSQYQVAILVVRARPLDSGGILSMIEKIENRLALLPAHVRGRVTGNTALIARTVDDIAYGQALSLLTAFAIIYLILALLFMSFRVGLMALIPNALPVLFYFGALGWTGISLNTTTGLVACLVLGIAVDDTIHFFSRFNSDSKKLANEEKGVRSALLNVGRPITYTSIALCLGFSLLGLSTLKNQAEFGLLAAITLAFAWAVDLSFTPALASRIRVVTLWDALTLDLGERPQDTIPLFRGLSGTQARVAALMTDLLEFPAGHRLIRAGDEAEGMYVVIEGVLKSHLQRQGQRVDLNTHQRGDVLGEVGLLRGKRSADVDCESDVRLLYFEPEDLTRLEKRYSRISARLSGNLSEILAERLVAATARLRASSG